MAYYHSENIIADKPPFLSTFAFTKEIWEENDFGECPDWFTKDTLPKNWDEVEQVLKFE